MDHAAYVDAAAAALGLKIAAAHRPGVLQYFALAAAMAELVNGLRGLCDQCGGCSLRLSWAGQS